MQILNDGEYLEISDRPAVRFVRRYAHPAQQVWDTITDPAQFRHWFPHPHVEYERRLGGTIRVSGDPHDPNGSEGKVLAWDPPREFGFDWGKDQVFLVVSEDVDGSRLELVNALAERGGAARNGAGWDFCLGDPRACRTTVGCPTRPEPAPTVSLPMNPSAARPRPFLSSANRAPSAGRA